MKKIMVLGASFLQTFIIKKIRDLGYYSIVIDGNPQSEGFFIADKYYTCSTTDTENVLKIAKKEKIDGILTYASDVSSPTVAFVAEALNLPTNPFNSVKILTDKALTRKFMIENGFNVPKNHEVANYRDLLEATMDIGFPAIVKPVDSSGSKGVSKICNTNDVQNAFNFAIKHSLSKRIIVESFIKRKGYEIDADAFMYNGKLVYFLPMDQHQDPLAPYSPIGISAPSILDNEKSKLAFTELNRLLQLLNMKMGAFNVEYAFDENNNLYFYEIGPRSGGNLISDVIHQGTGFDIQKNIILACVGDKCEINENYNFSSNVTSFLLHSQEDGIFEKVSYDPIIKSGILYEKIFVSEGERVSKFRGASCVLGMCLIKFDSADFMRTVMDNSKKYIKIKLK